MERRLTTILSADVAGYGRLMEEDEHAALGALKANTQTVVEPLARKYGARIVKNMGDGFLAEFTSVVNAVHFATDLQAGTEARNSEVPESQGMHFRIGINLSDVIADGEDLYGDGVNLAVRLQGLAETGGICISETVYHHVRRHMSFQFEDVGDRQLKHIAIPQKVYRVVAGGAPQPRRRPSDFHASIAVLPFTNLSGDPEQDYFGDGIAEDIITDLSKVSALFVVARNTSATFKGKAVEIDQVARKLDVKYVLEGSVRKAGSRIRITAQLIDGATNGHIWAERYDRSLDDLLAVQDEIASNIVAALKVKLLPEERSDILRKPTENTEAYRYYLMARSVYHRGGPIRRSLRVAKQMFQKATDLDPSFARAHASIADCDCFLLDAGDSAITFEEIMASSERALALDATLAEAHAAKGHALYTKGLYEEASACFQKALEFDPNLFEGHFFAGRNAFNQGQLALAAQYFDRAAELKQDDYRSLGLLSMCLQSMGQVEDSAIANRKALARIETFIQARPDEAHALAFGAGILAMLGEKERAIDWADRALVIEPDDHDLAYNLACAFALIGQVDRAVDLLEGAIAGLPLKSRIEYMHQDSDLAALRGHPRFEALLNKSG